MPVEHVKSAEDFTKLVSSKDFKATIVDFTASWCGPCQMIKPIFEQHSNDFKTLQFIKVDVDELEDVSASAGINAMPTFQVYQNGEKVDELVGASQLGLLDLIKKYA